ncbi:UbiE family methyltransferase [Sparassis latifolia]
MSTETAHYIHGYHESVLRSHSSRTAANSAAYLLSSLRPDMRILDVGCGPGTITIDLAALVPNGHVIGVELSDDVLEKARANAAVRGVKNVQFHVGDVNGLTYPDGTFDVVHAHQVLQHVGDPVRVLREMRRVTKPGGIIAVREAVFAASTWYPDLEGITEWNALYVRVARANGGDPYAGRRLHAWAREAGFDLANITKTASVSCYSSPEERAWWGTLWADRVVASEFARTAIEKGFATKEDLERYAQVWRDWIAEEDGWFAYIQGEILATV